VPELWEAAQRACMRSRMLLAENREALIRHSEAIASLRSAVSVDRAPTVRAAASEPPGRPLALDEEVAVGQLTLLPLRTAVAGVGRPVHLTPAEWQLLVTLVQHRRSILSRAELATRAWGPAFAGRHSEVEVYISRLRRKLMRAGTPALIRTVRGHGYRLCVDGNGANPT
jgi:DNA-binding response OmpR family regulator